MKKLFGVAVWALALTSGAQAADIPAKAAVYKAPPLAVYDWTGWYVGLNVGVGASQTRGTFDVPGGFEIDRSGTGLAAGVQGGYNWQFAPFWVAGIEGDIGYFGTDRSFHPFAFGATFGVKTNWYATVRGRLGYTNGPSLFYVTGGAAFVNVRNNNDADDGRLRSNSETATGWTIGGGIETALGANWSGKGEYLYIDASKQDVAFSPTDITHFDNRFHVFRYGLNYKFGATVASARASASNDWSGFYAGVNAGVGLSRNDFKMPRFLGGEEIATSGFTGGVQAGYNRQINTHLVAGVEGDFNYLGIKNSIRTLTGLDNSFATKVDWYGTIRARLGYGTDPALLYATGGAAFVRVKNMFDLTGGTSTNIVHTPTAESKTATGWTVGGGIEAALAQNWTAKTEYLYINAGSQDVLSRFGPIHFDNSLHVFRFGLNYKFGGL
jgi:outer membrane immunogenic protein